MAINPDQDPATLTDEELQEAINPTAVVEEPETPESPEEPETPEEPTEPVAPVGEEEEVVEQPQPSRRESLRIQQLLQKYPELDPESPPAPRPQAPPALDYDKELEADPETVKRLQEDRQQYAEALYRQGLEQTKSIQFHTRLEVDAPKIEAKFPQLDPKNEKEFKPVLAQTINQMYLSSVGYDQKTDTVSNPNIRYADYVEAIFELGDEIGTQKVAATKTNIVKQAAQTAVRPDGSSPKATLNLNKEPEQMTTEELHAYLAKNLPGYQLPPSK